MNVRRYIAPTARDCLRKVKEELGPDAIVVSNKPVSGGVEIMAMTADGFEALSRQAAPHVVAGDANPRPVSKKTEARLTSTAAGAAPPRTTLAARPAPAAAEDDYTVSLSSQARKQPVFHPSWQVSATTKAAAPVVSVSSDLPQQRPHPLPTWAEDKAGILSGAQVEASLKRVLQEGGSAHLRGSLGELGGGTDTELGSSRSVAGLDGGTEAQPQFQSTQLMGEMQTIKALLERQLAGFAWGEMSREAPTRALALAEMLDAGFSGLLARKLCQEMPAKLSIEEARKWLKSAINRRLRTLGSDSDIIERGGVYALVGPTGVGKTTTTAKLAARCVVRYGADKIALLTTDGYRIGAHEQLRIYGRILGVPVHVVRDGDDLRHTLTELRDKHMVLIDTVGMSQRDRMVAEQAAMLMRAGEVNRLLLLNATSRGDTLDDVVRAYAGEDLAGVILSKVDESASIAPALDVVARHGLLLCYVANGQRVPEDMHLPNRNYLLHRAFKLTSENSPHHLLGEEAGLVLAPPGVAGAAMALHGSGAALV
ncbi:MAG: flagellar biosynthesis protein FlhF [Sterolibacterium sp.]|nr:flagellar biosynthesis protein FlhF [Sterolibacterium sp.]